MHMHEYDSRMQVLNIICDTINMIMFCFIDSERSEECIDFTMMCVFFFVFVSVHSISSRNNAPISNYGGGFRCKTPLELRMVQFCWTVLKKNYLIDENNVVIFNAAQLINNKNDIVIFWDCKTYNNMITKIIAFSLRICFIYHALYFFL
ncbi:Uncharacterized protein FWK35_00018972 [Aphis craccivora]|uniref:Uncharacterized protein n=1 Tax=Aphis craccivora TaxID=307492 RepID=A0A6G0Y8H1_APHCR|nr:Uncharacterized protein FWK35_00018972 [Aphis craccivora]